MCLVGREDLVREPWFASGRTRFEHADELDAAVGAWIAARDADEVIDEFEKAQAAIAPIYDVRDIVVDPQYKALGTIVHVPDEELGTVAVQNVPFRMSQTPGEVRWVGRRKGRDTEEVLEGLGYSEADRAGLRDAGVI